ncbi:MULTISPECIES: proline racemase family protein [Oceanobacillus]|uniref:Proline racemase family protein n=1 Tax=Oceanobacillus aidingensis TaxID=645964 RepID=A0ABV9K3Z7_9BACI|nr:proline racemase family protein [Oceanobacillus oncorhynchi]MDM8099766.1 proline racemase family protein [Oceanobacillus oncorhynchi]
MKWSRKIDVVGAHAEGEVGNVVVGGIPPIPGDTMFEKKEYFEKHMDDIRKLLLFEPRGGPFYNANILVPPAHPEADMGYIILESTEYPPMSGSNTICVATVLLENGILPMREPVTELVLEAPGGLIKVKCVCEDGKVKKVELTNVRAFAIHLNAPVKVEGIGDIQVDTSYGGMMFAHVNAQALGFHITPDEAHEMCLVGQKIKKAVNEQLTVVHPENSKIRNVSNIIFEGPLKRSQAGVISKNGTVVLHGRMDRSPCGTGTSARLAVMYAKGLIDVDEEFENESITGTKFNSKIISLSKVKDKEAIVPKLSGQAWITGLMNLGVDPTDPIQSGHQVSDIWF